MYLTVTTPADVIDPSDGKLSLREAVARANASSGADTIVFAASIEGMTLTLTQGELTLTHDVAIDGDRNDDGVAVTLSGGGTSRVLSVRGTGTSVALSDLTIRDGFSAAGNGGGIELRGEKLSLNFSRINMTDNRLGVLREQDAAAGAAIYAGTGSRLTVTDSSFSGNVAAPYGRGGAIAANGATVVIRGTVLERNVAMDGGAIAVSDSSLTLERSTVRDNAGSYYKSGSGGGIKADNSTVVLTQSTISGNDARYAGGGIALQRSQASIDSCTIADNESNNYYGYGQGSGIDAYASTVSLANSTVTGNGSGAYSGRPAVFAHGHARLSIANTIVAGNFDGRGTMRGVADVGTYTSTILVSNGHNVFGSAVAGSIPGDRVKIAPATVFAAVDPATGGGKLDARGVAPLKEGSLANPALSAADPITAAATGQLGGKPRPQPAGSLPDIGAVEADQKLSTSPTTRNDVITGTGGANSLAGLAGNDLIRGLGGKDVLHGNDGSDLLDGGPGNDVVDGGPGMDIATFAGTTAVVVDLGAKPATARRGGETDTLTSIEGIIGSDKADTFKGDGQDNEFQGGPGKDTATGGGGRDLYALKSVADSPAGSGRDVIKDFAPGQDVIDVGAIDADETTPGRQSFRWVGKATLTGAAQLGYYVSGGNTIVRASTDGDAAAELEIQLTGGKTLTAGDFRF